MNDVDGSSGRDRQGLEGAIRQAEFVYARLETRLHGQLALADVFDRKLATSLGFSGAVVGLFAAAIVIGAGVTGSTAFIGTELSAAIGTTAALFSLNLLVAVGGYGYFTTWANAPDSGMLAIRSEGMGAEDHLNLLARSSDAVRYAIGSNARPLRVKGMLTTLSITLAGATGLSVAASALIAVAM